ncbi:MAG: multifunctional oxoglutarate decarboxylase/oxoglutarate dehydrogenase thiamine pyrophosphate-binding subunit/dihydrolipoyllysine-residue succinyltransferase subunit [Planctomycetes bacterium]|nr:multifunctional oxoglutarate decarboxylase/oxoglutarate dehydrogenase thiamine pyrophosphate-binding subunit/dihydrolipoyllysine-residue succinyltransferase subunit [Planctomycetota bacterium]
MHIDFESAFGVNAGYVEALFERWWADPAAVDATWAEMFERLAGPRPQVAPAPVEPVPQPVAAKPAEAADVEVLRGIALKIAENMAASLEVPTATSVRTLPVKVLDENRRVLNGHMKARSLGKASFTHVIAYALVRAVHELPRVQARYEVRDGKGCSIVPHHVNLGLAIDVPQGEKRMLVVPVLKQAEQMDFATFFDAYQDLVERGRKGKLKPEDFQGATLSLTNPGGFGTQMSVPRLMQGQGLIVATGSIGVPVEAMAMASRTLAKLALGPVMTMTSTYDHRVIQGAESALLLQRVEQLLQGEGGFYESVFASMRVPWKPVLPAEDAFQDREEERAERQSRVMELIQAYRSRGCRLADLDPLAYAPDPHESLDPSSYGFTIWDYDREFPTGGMCGKATLTLREILEVLRESYCRRWTIEYTHIVPGERHHWLRRRIEDRRNEDVFSREDSIAILSAIYRAENFERFLHSRFVGNKRFSLEGGEALIPALMLVIAQAAERGVQRVVIGMAHRGRLNVLANILNKSSASIFREFEGVLLPLSTEGSGDVKYHLGQKGSYRTQKGKEVEVFLSSNPSHLEAVDPVVCGMTRGFRDTLGEGKVLAVLVHGDAAFSGQGVVVETLNMSSLPGYECGGTIHLVVNNQIGFTAGPRDLRSTYYCTDVAKSVGAPILHANGDNPEAVLKATMVACEYQAKFAKDAVVDIVCYRRWGHNEGDEPAYTQPVLYKKIRQHPTVCERYTDLLVRRGTLTREDASAIHERFQEELRAALEESRSFRAPELPIEEVVDIDDDDPADWLDAEVKPTAVPRERLVEIVDRTNAIPTNLATHPNLLRQLHRRESMVRGEKELDWGCAETLAFGSILLEGCPIRLTGQDSGRGTFSHRHAIIRDQESGADHVPLQDLAASAGASFEVRDSLLSEYAVMGFEYGYAVARPEALVLWEAQFGDFANGAQICIDQFLSSSEAKWRQRCGLVLLLPHGYDGQGPEHSNAHPERFLSLCAGGNWTILNPSTAAQYFHALRRQARAKSKRALVVFTPKSLLRDPRAASRVEDLEQGSFQPVIELPVRDPKAVTRVVFASGKVTHELEEHARARERHDVALVRLEQLYPFPRRAVKEIAARYPQAKLVWCQEEPRNLGPWPYLVERSAFLGLRWIYAGRPFSSSPATGSFLRHQSEQERLVRRAFGEL